VDYRVVISQIALYDLQDIVEYLRKDDPNAAKSLGLDLVRKAESLGCMPERGKPVDGRPGVRWILRYPYLIFYRINQVNQVVEILRFWHSAQNPKRLDFD